MATWGPARFNVSREAFELTFSVMLVTISFTPMVLAPLSELVGKSRLSGDMLTPRYNLGGMRFFRS